MHLDMDSDCDDILDMSQMDDKLDVDVDDYGSNTRRNIVFNKFLPYAHLIEEEAKTKLSQIKANLCKAVLYRELKPGCYFWTNQLLSYIYYYGRKFSKEDHVAFIKLLYELVTIPDLEFFLVDNFARVLMTLLQKKELLSQKDLVLQWRPLFQLYERVAYNKWSKRNLTRIPNSCKSDVQALIRHSRIYFPVDATQEMLDEWRPYLCPYAKKEISKAMEYFELFLPTIMSPEDHDKGFKLWFSEFMQIWEVCHNTPTWESNIVYLFSRLAESNIGYVDWDPYIPMILTRLMRSFHLPVYMKHVRFQSTKEHYNISAAANLLVSMLGGGSVCQDHLTKLFKSLESFYHPSNNGIWNIRLQQIIVKLTVCFVKRLKRERHTVKTWETPIPSSHQLTDDDITAFVNCLKPCVMFSMFSKTGCYDAAVALKNLAILRPELIIPPILERYYPATQTLIEPHRLLAVLQCLAYVVMPMVRGGKYLPNGPTHVLTILTSCLPGIDPNDTHKTLSTFQLIACLVTLVPLVDCSQMMHESTDLTETERELCSASAQFEDFVLQFLDRCFVIIESSSLEISLVADRIRENISSEEEQIQYCMTSVFNMILNQSSPQIRETAINKLCNFVIGRILGVKDAGYLAAKLISATVCKIKCEQSLKTLLPMICNIIDENVHDNSTTPTNPNQELLFNMLILQELVCCDGRLLLPYRESLLRVLKKLVNLDDKEGCNITCQILKNILASLTNTYLLEQSNTNPSSSEDDIPIKKWGSTIDINTLQMPWHVTSKEELEFAQQLVDTFLCAEITKLTSIMEGKTTLSREKLQRSVSLIHAMLCGCLSRCPLKNTSDFTFIESCTQLKTSSCIMHDLDEGHINLNGENLRETIAQWLHQFAEYVLKNHEDNIIVLCYVIKIFQYLMFYWVSEANAYQKDWKYSSGIRKILDNPFRAKKHQLRYLILHRVNFQHHARVIDHGFCNFSKFHYSIMCDLLNFSTNHYTEVRCLAQRALEECYVNLPFSYRALLPHLEDLVNNAASFSHEKLKGLLHVLLGEQHSYCLLARRDWEAACKLWPVVVKTPISDQPSVNLLLDNLVGSMNKNFETFSIYEQVPQSVLTAAMDLWSLSRNHFFPIPGQSEIDGALVQLEKNGDKNFMNYNSLITQQLTLLEAPNLHWQSFQLGFELLTLLIRHDVPFPANGVQLILRSTLSDSPVVRYLAVDSLSRIMLQTKCACAYVEVSPLKFSTENDNVLHYEKQMPVISEEWDTTLFLDKPHLGFYKWPKILKLHAASDQQAVRFKSRECMNEVEGLIYDFFTNPTTVEQLIKFLSAEINKDTDKFEAYRCNLFKNLFSKYGIVLLPHLSTHIETLLNGTLDSHKRCGIEIVTGLIAGSKYWKYDDLQKAWQIVTPLLKNSWSNVTVELQNDWNRGMSYIMVNTDPRRLQWIFDILLNSLLVSNDGSFVEANRLLMLYVSLSEQVWKAPNLLHRILNTVQSHLAHPYQNIRDELGRLLSLVFLTDVDAHPFPSGHLGPSQKEFVNSILPKFKVFEKVVMDTGNGHPVEPNSSLVIPEDDPEWKHAVALLKTVCRWLRRRLGKSLQVLSPDIIQLLPVLCLGETCDRDPELQNNCRLAIAVMGHAYLPPAMVISVIQTMVESCKAISWRGRKTALEYLQVLIFSNLFTILQFPQCIEEVNKVVLKLLEDSRTEVQQVAAQVLSGLLHCNILDADEKLLNTFVTWSNTPIKKKSSSSSTANGLALRKRHAGILGMGAFVRAHPYDICDGMPGILVSLASHLHDPQPLQTTVRQLLTNFWRTHHDNWHDHKLKFTDDQLSDITDLLVSPNYYA